MRLVSTEKIVAFLVMVKRDDLAMTEEQAKNAIKRWSHEGKIKNYGGTRRGQARWDPKEIKAALRLQSG